MVCFLPLITLVLCVHRETVEALPERLGDRHRVRIDNIASEALHTNCAGLVAFSHALSLCEASVPRDLAATSAVAILSSFRACKEAGCCQVSGHRCFTKG